MDQNNKIGYFVHSNIQHLPPVIQLYPVLGGTIITTKMEVVDFVNNKYAHLNISIIFCKNLKQARNKAKSLQLRVIIYTSFHLLYCGKSVQIFHGGLSDKRYLESARLICYDLVLFPGQKSVDKVSLATTLPWINHWEVVGYPKFDPLINNQLQALKLFDNDKKIILYAPTWVSQVTSMRVGERSKYGESSLQIWSLALIEQLSADYNIVLKYHSNMKTDKLSIYSQIEQLIDTKNLSESVKTVIDDNILPYMNIADLMISDISSVCYEWLHFDRPIIFANPAPGKYSVGSKITDNTYVWQVGEVLNSPDEIKNLVDREIKQDFKGEIRNKIFNYAIFQADGNATKRQAGHIQQLYLQVKDKPWWSFNLGSFLTHKYKRILASFFRFSKGIPR